MKIQKLIIAAILCSVGFGAAILTPSRTELRDFLNLSRAGSETTLVETALPQLEQREVETGYYNVVVRDFPIPSEITSSLKIAGRIVEYAEFIDETNLVFLVGSNSLPLGIQPADVIANEPGTTNALLIFGSLIDGEITFSKKSIDLNKAAPSLGQVRDLLYLGEGEMLISNVDASGGCFALEVWQLSIDLQSFQVIDSSLRFRSTPCIRDPINAADSGGRLAPYGKNREFLLTIGNFGLTDDYDLFDAPFLRRNSELVWPANYGMTIWVNAEDEPQLFTSGHRNPQGLFVEESTNQVFLSEQGPRGGDEINALVQGSDYGWPNQSLGTPYSGPRPDASWSELQWATNHESFSPPLHAWMPSVAPGQILKVIGAEFPLWSGDLLVTTLRDQSLRRLQIIDGQVILDERIEVGHRVRDAVIATSGAVVLLFDDGIVGVLTVKK